MRHVPVLRINDMKRVARGPPCLQDLNQRTVFQRLFRRIAKGLNNPHPGHGRRQMRIAFVHPDMMLHFQFPHFTLNDKAKGECSARQRR
ncbi:hypothetical protein D3C86_1604430 [compost metagenome]